MRFDHGQPKPISGEQRHGKQCRRRIGLRQRVWIGIGFERVGRFRLGIERIWVERVGKFRIG
jgi:hypothetical protein